MQFIIKSLNEDGEKLSISIDVLNVPEKYRKAIVPLFQAFASAIADKVIDIFEVLGIVALDRKLLK